MTSGGQDEDTQDEGTKKIPPPLTSGDPGYDAVLDEVPGVFQRPMYFDRHNNPLTLRQYAVLTQDDAYKQLAFTRITPDVCLSTVWLGLDHSFFHEGPPLIFETSVSIRRDTPVRLAWFDRELFWDGGEIWRWHTEREATEGHTRIVGALSIPDTPAEIETQER